MKISAIIITYNRKSSLLDCLDGIVQQTYPIDAVFIIDNGSTDQTLDALREQGYLARDVIHYVRIENNMGAAAGFARGFKCAEEQGYDWFWIMDDDAIPKADALERLFRHADARELRIFTSYQTGWKRKGPRYGLPKSIGEALLHSVSCQIRVSENGPTLVPVDWCSLTSFLVPKSAVCAIGFPRAEFFLYWDDLDFTLRLRQAGYHLFLVTDSIVEHLAGAEIVKNVTEGTGLRRYYNYRNQIANIIIHRRFIGKWRSIAALVRISAGAVVRIIFAFVRNERETVYSVRRGVLDGYHVSLGKHREGAVHPYP